MKFFLVFVFLTCSLFAVDNESFGQLNSVFVNWLNGNLGRLLALVGFMIWFLGFIFIKGDSLGPKFIFSVGLVPLLAGGMVGIANMFFGMGITVF